MNELEQQHENAKVLHAYLTGGGYDATIELGGGGVLIVYAPIDGGAFQPEHRILYAPYASDELVIETLEECGHDWAEPFSYADTRFELVNGRLDITALERWFYEREILPAYTIRKPAGL